MSDDKLDRCPVCGAMAPLHAVHVLPTRRRTGGRSNAQDFVYLCPSCNYQLDQHSLREFEFEIVLADLMQASSAYKDVRLQAPIELTGGRRVRPDISATETATGAMVVVECKSFQTIVMSRLRDAITQLLAYGGSVNPRKLVLALPARITDQQRMIAAAEGVDVWDLDDIATRFRAGIEFVTHPVLRPLLLAVAALVAPGAVSSPEQLLLEELQNTEPGRGEAAMYQKLIARILERLFCPPLSPPLLEHSDHDRVNRRDIILPNYADGGFWGFVRQRYEADFIVVDAKNYSDPVGKHEALQVLHYLKPHGAGMLGLIVTRKGNDAGCIATIREHWSSAGKLLVVVDDNHVAQMLRVREAGGPPEEVIRQCIEEFRLSL